MKQIQPIQALAVLLLTGLLTGAGWSWAYWRTHPASPEAEKDTTSLEAYPWIYQREKSTGEASEPYELILVGDILAGRDTQTLENIEVPASFQTANLLVGNLEGAIADLTLPVEKERAPYHLAGGPDTALDLAESGFDLLGLANNHALDLNNQGLKATTFFLDEAGIAWVGAGTDAGQASQPRYWQAGRLRLAFLAVNAVSSPQNSQPQAGWVPAAWEVGFTSRIQEAHQHADIVIVLVHWGLEYQHQIDPAQHSMAQSMLAAGADLIIGSHPHVVQGIEVYPPSEGPNPKITAYSLGNFIFDQSGMDTDTGLALRVVLDEKGISGVQTLPVRAGMQPELLSPETARTFINNLLEPAAPVVFSCTAQTCSSLDQPKLQTRVESGGLFWSGWEELTGDQNNELVRREAEQVIVYQAGAEVWRTPASWQVLDAALGDPDGDGREDILLAMLKPDANGILRSHPFIMGYRGGIYRNLWGGSAVSDPILEVELGNIDENPGTELVVLEERDSGLIAITVWDWHGWGFSLRWRSPEGAYKNLRLALDPAGGPAWILVDPR